MKALLSKVPQRGTSYTKESVEQRFVRPGIDAFEINMSFMYFNSDGGVDHDAQYVSNAIDDRQPVKFTQGLIGMVSRSYGRTNDYTSK